MVGNKEIWVAVGDEPVQYLIKSKDLHAFQAVVEALKIWLARWHPAPSGAIHVNLYHVAGHATVARNVVLRIARQYPMQIAAAVQAVSGEYQKGEYRPSGRGAFGRLKGGTHGQRIEPTLLLRWR
jgi:hypothetical protein